MTEWLISTFSWLPTDNSYYLLIFAITFFESFVIIGLIMPGSTLAVIAGFLAYHGHGDIWSLAISASIGSALGDGVSYCIGRRYGDSISQHKIILRYSEAMDRGKKFFADHGFKSVIFARFIGLFRPFIPFVAGWMKMPSQLFILYSTISCILWGIAYPGLGYLFGESWHLVTIWSGRFSILIGLLLFTALASQLFWRILVPEGRRLFHHYSDNKKGIISPAKLSFVLSVITIGITVGLTGIVLWYRENTQNGGIDRLLNDSLAILPSTEFDQLIWLLSGFGTFGILSGSICIISACLIYRDEAKEALLLLLLIATVSAVTITLNRLSSGTLPSTPFVPISEANRSVSIQLTLAMFLYPIAAWLLSLELNSLWHERIVTLSSILPISIFLSRLYLGIDWASGLLIGIVVGIGSFFLFLAISPALPPIAWRFSNNSKRIVSLFLLVAGVCWLAIAIYSHLQQTPIRTVTGEEQITIYAPHRANAQFNPLNLP